MNDSRTDLWSQAQPLNRFLSKVRFQNFVRDNAWFPLHRCMKIVTSTFEPQIKVRIHKKSSFTTNRISIGKKVKNFYFKDEKSRIVFEKSWITARKTFSTAVASTSLRDATLSGTQKKLPTCSLFEQSSPFSHPLL